MPVRNAQTSVLPPASPPVVLLPGVPGVQYVLTRIEIAGLGIAETARLAFTTPQGSADMGIGPETADVRVDQELDNALTTPGTAVTLGNVGGANTIRATVFFEQIGP